MDAVTYPESKVAKFVNNNMVPLRISFDLQPYATDFNIKWTPTIVTIDSDCKEHHRTLGFLPPMELIPSLLLGMGKAGFDQENYDAALENFEKVIDDYPESDSTPEAIYMRGVALFKKTHEPGHLKDAYEKLSSEYPSSEWERRAKPYELL
jgi:tetratricopeptide (TPR) repeat protein